MDLIGTKGRIALRRSVATVMFIHRGTFMTPVEGHQWQPVSLPDEDHITGQHLGTRDINFVLQSRLIQSLVEPDDPDADPISSGREGPCVVGNDSRFMGVSPTGWTRSVSSQGA